MILEEKGWSTAHGFRASRTKIEAPSDAAPCFAHDGERRGRSAVFVLSFPLPSSAAFPDRLKMAEFDAKRFHERLEKLHSSLVKHRYDDDSN